jgi:hypothetical protein
MTCENHQLSLMKAEFPNGFDLPPGVYKIDGVDNWWLCHDCGSFLVLDDGGFDFRAMTRDDYAEIWGEIERRRSAT